MSGQKFDAIVIGGGHNGLVAAAYLAKEEMKTLVIEKRPVLGGACITEELWPGFRLSRLSYAYSLFREEIVNDLQLRKWGLSLSLHDPFSFVPFPDGKYLFLWNDLQKTVKEIEKFSEHDAQAYGEYSRFWDGVAQIFDFAFLSPPPALADMIGMFQEPDAQEVLRRLMFFSVNDLLDEYFESDHLKAALATQGIIGTMAGPMTPGTAYVLGHHLIGNAEGQRGAWAYVKGGMGGLTDALAKSAKSFGADIIANTGVSKILVKDGKAHGVETEDGRRFESRVILSNADPKQTLLKLVGPDHLDKQFAKKLNDLKDEGCVVKVNAVVKELPDYSAFPGKEPGPQHYGTTDIAPSMEYLERAYHEAQFGAMSREPFLEVAFHSLTDPSLARPGYHTMSIFAQYFPYQLKSGNWEEKREEAGDRIIETLAEYAPNMGDAVVKREVLTPYDMERIFSLPKGNIFHIEITPDQMFSFRPLAGWSQYRTPIGGLYLCGSGTHPGGGVTGAPGYNASKIVISDVRQISAM
jgi:phytoene dehydrogenase-like protein